MKRKSNYKSIRQEGSIFFSFLGRFFLFGAYIFKTGKGEGAGRYVNILFNIPLIFPEKCGKEIDCGGTSPRMHVVTWFDTIYDST